jgi:membrane dipeptidase
MPDNLRPSRRDFLKSSAGLAATAAAMSPVASFAADDLPKKTATQGAERINTKIAHDREVALGLLKPTKKDLEHGLELHKESIVFDGYGFSPRSAIDGDRYAKKVEAGASEAELDDLREDMSMTRCVTDPIERAEFLQAWKASGVTCIFQNAGEEGQAPLTLMKRLARFTFVTDMLRDSVSKAVTPDDIVAAKKAGRHCLYLTGNGVPLTQQWVSVEEELRYLRLFFQLGIRMMHLTYQRRNMIGSGSGEKNDGGLSDFGEHVVKQMNKTGVIVDVAHSGWTTALQAAQLSEKPMVASHTTCAELYPHFRAKPDNVIRAIADTGGYIGICCISRFLRGKGDINRMLDHVDHVVKKFGADHVAFGTDVAYTSRNAAAESRKVPRRRRKTRLDWRSLWPNDPYVTTSEARNSIAWTNWPLFTVGMVQRGHSDEVIKKILGGNVMRVAEAALK